MVLLGMVHVRRIRMALVARLVVVVPTSSIVLGGLGQKTGQRVVVHIQRLITFVFLRILVFCTPLLIRTVPTSL